MVLCAEFEGMLEQLSKIGRAVLVDIGRRLSLPHLLPD